MVIGREHGNIFVWRLYIGIIFPYSLLRISKKTDMEGWRRIRCTPSLRQPFFQANVEMSCDSSCRKSPGDSLLFSGRTLKKSLPTPLLAQESSSLCLWSVPRKVLPTLALKRMEVSHDQYGPRSSCPEMHVTEIIQTKKIAKMRACDVPHFKKMFCCFGA